MKRALIIGGSILFVVGLAIGLLLWRQKRMHDKHRADDLASERDHARRIEEYLRNQASLAVDTGPPAPVVDWDKSPLRPMLRASLKNYSFKIKADSCEATETGEGNYKFTIRHVACASPREYHFSVFSRQSFGGTVDNAGTWFKLLNMELAALKTETPDPPMDFTKVLKAAIIAQNDYQNVDPDLIKAIHFEGGYLLLERLEMKGNSSTLEFTIYVVE